MAASVVEDAAAMIDESACRHNPNYHIEVGGSVEGAKRAASVLAMLPVMAVIILIVLMFQLQSVQRLLLVISVVPLGLIGVVLAMLITNTPVGFIAVLGMIALIGMITRNSVVLIDQMDTTHSQRGQVVAGRHRRDRERLRPVFLTAGSTVLRHAADHSRSVLGSARLHRHRRPGGRRGADPRLPARTLRPLVPHSPQG